MTLLKALWDTVTSKAHNQERPPSIGMGAGNFSGLGAGGNLIQQMSTYSTVSWVFAAVSRISEAVAASEWHLYRGPGTATEVFDHPALKLWNTANPFDTRQEFLEMGQQHYELTGEEWWVLVRNGRGVPVEMWVVRPDRMMPIKDHDNYILGYQYTLGAERIFYDPLDVIFIRHPNPMDPFRGLGPISSLILDLGSEVEAANFNRAFFRNDATPGGIIETERSMSNAEFKNLVDRWKTFHQGTSNAGRMGFLERAKFVERKYTQRDMQFVQLREQTRNLVLAAYGVPLPMLGVMEAPSRANAQAAEYIFARWTIRPRLARIKLSLNSRLLKLFPDRGLHFEFEDPTPNNRELDLEEATKGYVAGIHTRDEARALLELDPLPEDEPEAVSGVDVATLALNGAQVTALLDIVNAVTAGLMSPDAAKGVLAAAFPSLTEQQIREIVDAAVVFTPSQPLVLGRGAGSKTISLNKALDPLEKAERAMELGWARRLKAEAEALVAYLEEILGKGISTMSLRNALDGMVTKVELADIEGFDWNWWDKYKDDVIKELADGFRASVVIEFPQIEPLIADDLAAQYAEARGARLLRVDGDLNIVNSVRARVNTLVSQTIDRGDSLQTLQRSLRDDFAFSPEKARTVARTETATAQGEGAKKAAIAQGFNEKRWITQGDDVVDATGAGTPCLDNEAQGWIKLGDPFTSGHDTIPAHPNCRCNVRHRIKPLEEERSVGARVFGQMANAVARHEDAKWLEMSTPCPRCQKADTVVINRDGPGMFCRRCNLALPEPAKALAPAHHSRSLIKRDDQGRIEWIDDIEVTE